MRDDERQGILVVGTDVDEMDGQPVDFCRELRQRVEFCLSLAPVVVRLPVVGKSLHRGELDPLRGIRDRLAFGPAGGGYAPAKVGEFFFRGFHGERADRSLFRCNGCRACQQAGGPGGSRRGKHFAPRRRYGCGSHDVLLLSRAVSSPLLKLALC